MRVGPGLQPLEAPPAALRDGRAGRRARACRRRGRRGSPGRGRRTVVSARAASANVRSAAGASMAGEKQAAAFWTGSPVLIGPGRRQAIKRAQSIFPTLWESGDRIAVEGAAPAQPDGRLSEAASVGCRAAPPSPRGDTSPSAMGRMVSLPVHLQLGRAVGRVQHLGVGHQGDAPELLQQGMRNSAATGRGLRSRSYRPQAFTRVVLLGQLGVPVDLVGERVPGEAQHRHALPPHAQQVDPLLPQPRRAPCRPRTRWSRCA